MNLVTICPPEPNESGLTKSQGTKVLLKDGSEVEGVTRIELTADVNDLWRAVIHCHARVLPITAAAEDFVDGCRNLPRWRYWLLWMAGFMVAQQPASNRNSPDFDGTAYLFDRGKK